MLGPRGPNVYGPHSLRWPRNVAAGIDEGPTVWLHVGPTYGQMSVPRYFHINIKVQCLVFTSVFSPAYIVCQN